MSKRHLNAEEFILHLLRDITALLIDHTCTDHRPLKRAFAVFSQYGIHKHGVKFLAPRYGTLVFNGTGLANCSNTILADSSATLAQDVAWIEALEALVEGLGYVRFRSSLCLYIDESLQI